MHYHWKQDDSLIKDIEFFAPHAREEAIIFTPPGVAPEKLWSVVDRLHAAHIAAVPDSEQGQPVLRVSRYDSRESLLNLLQQAGAVAGAPVINATDYDKKESWRPSTLQIGGALQLLADLLVMGYAGGRGKEGIGDIKASSKWAGAYLMLTLFGAKNPDKQVGYIYKDLKEEFARVGITVRPEDAASLAALAEKSGVFPKIERAIREYPILINSLIQASGGLSTIQAGLAQRDYNGQMNGWKIAGGSLTASGQIVGGVLLDPQILDQVKKTKKHELTDTDHVPHPLDPPQAGQSEPAPQDSQAEEPKPQKGFIAHQIDRIYEKPLRLTGAFSFLSNAARIISGLQETAKYKRFMGDVANDFQGGVYDARRQAFLSKVQNASLSIDAKTTLIDGIRSAEAGALKKAGVALGAGAHKEYHELIAQRDELSSTFRRIATSKQAATVDYIANGIKMVANIFIASSSSKIDADLKKTRQLDEICGFLSLVVRAQPPEKRELTLHSMAGMLLTQKGVEASHDEIVERLRDKVAQLEHNPWDRAMAKGVPERPAPLVQAASAHQVLGVAGPVPAAALG